MSGRDTRVGRDTCAGEGVVARQRRIEAQARTHPFTAGQGQEDHGARLQAVPHRDMMLHRTGCQQQQGGLGRDLLGLDGVRGLDRVGVSLRLV